MQSTCAVARATRARRPDETGCIAAPCATVKEGAGGDFAFCSFKRKRARVSSIKVGVGAAMLYW